jgi:hypothetical protein
VNQWLMRVPKRSISTPVSLPCTCSCCRMENLAATQNKLLMRLSQLRATEALFCGLVASCPTAAQQLPDLSYPLLTAAAGGGRAGLGSTTSGKAHAAATRYADSAGSSYCIGHTNCNVWREDESC